MVVLNHQYGLGRTVTARYFGTGDGSRVAFNLAGRDSDVAYVPPSLYVTDWRGGARTNYALQSQTLGTSWTTTGVTVSADGSVAPDGTTTMDKLAETAVSSEHYIEQTMAAAAGTWTISAYVKAAERTKGYLTAVHVGETATTSAILFDIAAGTITGAFQRVTATGIQSMGNGIYRIWATFTTTVACSSLRYRLQCADSTPQASYLGVLGSGYYAWGLQFESGVTVPTPYIPTTTAAVTVYDVSPTLLYGTSRTNLLLQSQTLGTTWSPTTVTVGTNDATAPDGTVTADSLTATAAGGSRLIQDVVATSTSHVYSIYVKNKVGGLFTLLMYNNTLAAVLAQTTLTFATGVLSATTGTCTVTNMGDGWFRVTGAVSTGITVGNTIRCYIYSGQSGQAIGDGVYAWGAQLETGTVATSYIPTTTQAASATDITSVAPNGLVTLATAPPSGANMTWTGSMGPMP